MRKNFLPELPGSRRIRSLLSGTPVITTARPTTLTLARPPKPTAARTGGGSGRHLALTELRGNLAITATTVTAWFTCADQVWPFQPDTKRENTITEIAAQYAALAGHPVHVRRTSVPFDVDQWAHNLNNNARPLPDVATGERIVTAEHAAHLDTSWRGHLDNARRRLADGQYTTSRTQIGVTFTRPGRMLRAFDRSGATDIDALLPQITEVAENLAAGGMQARPCTPTEMTWLMYRSVGIGLTPPVHHPGDVSPDDVIEFSERVDWQRSPYASTTKLTDRATGHSVYVAVLTVGRMEPLSIPQEHQPWAHLSDQLGFPVEWSSRFDVLDSAAARGGVQQRLRTIASQREDYADHGLQAPPELERLIARAAQVGDEIDTGLPVNACRAYGWHRLAVYADTQSECLDRARELTRVYAQQLHTNLAHPLGQVALLREFIPGEPVAATGHLRRQPVMLTAAAMPQATAKVGDDRGDLIGFTATSGERPVFFDPHYPMEVREASGLEVLVAEPGGGKSTLMGALGYLNARRGVRVTLMDPSGPLANLAGMPELAPYSRVIDLTGSQPGTLAPYAMVPTPARGDYPSQDKYEDAVVEAQAERRMLVLDICLMLLPAQVMHNDQTVIELRHVLRMVPPLETSTLGDVCQLLWDENNPGSHAHTIANLLDDMAKLPRGRLFFGRPPTGILTADAPFTVITMGGLRLPDFASNREFWSMEEALSVPMLHLANRLAVRRSYDGNRHARKLVGIDEAHILNGWPSGREFLRRLSRDSRKWNIAALVATQDPADILELAMHNLITSVFVGRIVDDPTVAADALRLLRVPTGHGYEATLAGLSQHSTASDRRLGFREFVIRDVNGNVQKVRIDISHIPGLLAALDTTPGGPR